jgi:hypothetical protein
VTINCEYFDSVETLIGVLKFFKIPEGIPINLIGFVSGEIQNKSQLRDVLGDLSQGVSISYDENIFDTQPS